MTRRFQIDIGFDPETEEYGVIVYSLSDGKGAPFKGTNLRLCMARASKLVREKNRQIKHFPISEPSRIIGINGGAPSIIVPARN